MQVQIPHNIDSPERQNFAGVSPRGFSELVFHSSNSFAFYDEMFLKFDLSERPL
jgi:hypothetical protein